MGFPGGLPEKFFSGESILPGRKFPSQNVQWAKAGRMRVTAESWLLMWTRGLDLLASNPKQVADINQWEHLAKHAAVLVAGRNEVQSAEAAAILQQVVGDWSNGSASVASELDAAIFTQAGDWSIVHLAVSSLLAARQQSAKMQHSCSRMNQDHHHWTNWNRSRRNSIFKSLWNWSWHTSQR